jgi:hypothetical protein
LADALGSTDSEEASACKFVGFTATTASSDFSVPFIEGYGSSPSLRGPPCFADFPPHAEACFAKA